ncbi:MAG: DUF4300 family protein [Limisphaerales bacterium]
MKRAIFILLLFFLLAEKLMEAAPIKISFLDNEDAIKQTMEFLLAKGCDQESVRSFRRVIDWYNSTPTDLDLKKFPPQENGFYSFQSVSNLVEALARPLIYTYHQNELNCFDTVILLAGSLLQTNLKPDDLAGPFLAPSTLTNNEVRPVVVATPQDAFNVISPRWWQETSKTIFTNFLQAKRICLTAALDSFYILPRSTTKENLGDKLLQTLRLSWERQGIVFPREMEIVICYDVKCVDGKGPQAVSSHVGLLFRNQDQHIFIEKLGMSAPYVRFDFKDKKDLFYWLRAEIEPTMGKGEFLFASFNDREIEDLGKIGN